MKKIVIFILILATFGYFVFNKFASPLVLRNAKSKSTSLEKLSKSKTDLPYFNVAQNQNRNSQDIFISNDKLKAKPLPTNKIWSSVLFSGKILGLFTKPLAYKTLNGELRIGSPSIIDSQKVITGQLSDDYFTVSGQTEIDKVVLVDYSDLTVSLEYRDSTDIPIFRTTIVQGSPYTFIYPLQNKLKIKNNKFTLNPNNVLSKSDKNFGIFSNAAVTSSNSEINFDFQNVSGGYLTLGLFNDYSQYEKLKQNSTNFVESINTDFDVTKSEIETQYKIKYTNASKNKSTIFGLLPHQQLNLEANTVLYEIETLRGRQKFVSATEEVKFKSPKNELLEKLEIKPDLLQKNIPTLQQTLLEDYDNLADLPEGSYFSGKYLAKIATMIQIANQVGSIDIFTKLQSKLSLGLQDWFEYSGGNDKRYFEYDKNIGGLIAHKPEFGLEEYNDHHFHYGYFIYAASILSKYDTAFFNNYSKFVDFLVEDIANPDQNDKFLPFARVFDFYEGHSWASGKQPFDDGNNQESSSEAINAWYSVWLWSQLVKNKSLENFAQYTYNMEVSSAVEYFLKPTKSLPSTGILWGGKVDYATFFTSDELAIRGIQYLPFTPGSIYLKNSSLKNLDFSSKQNDGWVDINLMYQGIREGLSVVDKKFIDTVKIDDGNSRSNMYYWLLYWEGLK
jgi:endoglucanase Acf2